MPSIFTPCAGGIVKVNACDDSGPAGAGSTFKIGIGDGTSIGFPIGGMALEMQGNYQFLHTLDQFIYYYNFGDRVGELTVSGFGFMAPGNACPATADKPENACGIYDLYLDNRQAKVKKAVTVTTGVCKSFFAFLTGMRFEVSSGSSGVPVGQWSLRFHFIPPRAE